MPGSHCAVLRVTDERELNSYSVSYAELILKDTRDWAGLFDQFAYTAKPHLLQQTVEIQNWPEPGSVQERFAGKLCLSSLEVCTRPCTNAASFLPCCGGNYASASLCLRRQVGILVLRAPLHQPDALEVLPPSLSAEGRGWVQQQQLVPAGEIVILKRFRSGIEQVNYILFLILFWEDPPSFRHKARRVTRHFQVCIKGVSHCPVMQNTQFL